MRVLRIFHSAVVDSWRERERRLRDLGVDVRLLSARTWSEWGTPQTLVAGGDDFVAPVRTFGRHPALFVYDPVPIWRALGEDWDVIDIHEEPFALATAEILAIWWLRGRRAPYLLYSAQNITKRYPIPFRWLERWALRHASGASVCNAEAGRILTAKGLPGRATYIPLGVDLERFSPAVEMTTRPPGAVVVGYVGRLEAHKGVHVLLDALRHDEHLRARIAGDGPERAALEGRAEELGVTAQVAFEGALPQHALPDFYRSVDVLAVPSLPTAGWLEQFGRVVVEAMACGTPVVASDSGSLPVVVGDGGVVVPPGDSVALAVALREVGGRHAAQRAPDAGALRTAARCSWARVAASHQALYERVLHRHDSLASGDVEVIVVAYGAPDLLRRTLAPVASLPVTVVDNSSSIDVRRVCAETGVRYLDTGHNGGFASGVNHGLRHRLHPGRDVLLLNPDAVIAADDVLALQRALHADPRLASVGPEQVDLAGTSSRVAWPFPSPLRTWLEAVGLGRLNRQADFVIGSVLLLRAEALGEVGELDESFFLYSEETDWAFRAARLGWRHTVTPTARAVHVGAATSADSDSRLRHFHASQERFLRKHHGRLRWHVARAGVVSGAAVRSVVLSGERSTAARERARLYLQGPIRAERRLVKSDASRRGSS